MHEWKKTDRKNSDGKALRLIVALLAVFGLTPIAIHAQTPGVVFSSYAAFVGAASSSGTNQDFSANIGRVAANQRGDVFFVNDNFSGNPDQMVMVPAGTTTQVLLISNLGSYTDSVTTDAQGNLWTLNGSYGLMFIPVTAGVYPTGLNASTVTTYCTLPAAGNNNSPCLLYLGGNSTLGSPALSDVQIDATGNIYALDFADNQTGYNNVDRILKFNPTTMVPTVVLDGLPAAGHNGRIALSTNGDLFEADGTNVYYSASGSGTKTTLSGFSQPTGVSSDSGGNIYVTETNSYSGNGSITVLPKVTGVVTPADRYTIVYGTSNGYGSTGAPDFSAGIDGFGTITWPGGGYGGDLFRTTPASLAFGPVPIGGYVNSLTLFVSFEKATTFGSFSIVSNSGSSAPFAVTVNNCTAGNAYAAGSSCSVLVNYEATATGPQAGTLFAYDNSSNLLGTAYLSGVGLAPVFNVDPGTAASIGSGWHAPSSITVDGAGNTYVADSTTGGIYKNGSSTAIVTGFSTPSSVVVDSVGNLYVADSGNNRVVEVPYSSSTYGTPVSIFTGTSGRAGLAIDALNNLYLADSGNSRVLFLAMAANLPAGSNVSPIGSGFSTPVAVATDSAGNVYISDNGTKKIYQYNFTRGTVVTIASGLTTAAGVAVDPGGNLFYVDSGTKAITRIPNRGGTVSATYASTVSTIVATPSSIAVDASGSVYVADSADASVGKLTKTSGTGTTAAALTIFNKGQAASFVPVTVSGGSGTLSYAISPTLPAGLSFASSTATISGTPTTGTPATAYTVTVTDANGTLATANFSLEVDAIAASTAIASTMLTKGQAASFVPVTATGGIGALTYAVSPTLPSGLSFASSTGTVSGTPTAVSSSSSYTVTVTDANGASSSASFSLGVNASVVATTAVSSTSLTQGHATTAFVPVTGSGGTTPLSYSVSPSLPSGLSYASSTGTVSGTPTAASSSTSYTVTVTDANSASATATFTLAVDSAVTASTAVASTSLTKNRAATSFVPVSGSGGTGTLTYSVSPTLPAGLSYASASGTVSGTPTAVSSATSYTVTVTDADGATATASFSLTVNSVVVASTAIASSTLTQGHAATAFVPVTGSGGTSPLSYSVSPSLPAGLSFASATGTVSGTPSAASSATTYTVTVTDANGATATSTFSLTVNSAVVATTAIATSGLTQGTASTAFVPVTGSGGTGTLSYAVSPTLPSGLSYAASSGTVSGTPTVTSAMTTYTVTVTDANSTTASANFSLAVNTAVTGATNFGSLAVAASTPTTMSLAFTFTTAGTIGAPRVLTQGATGLDFTDAGTGTCTTNGTSRTYNSGDSCTVIVAFTPTRVGERRGAVQIVNGSGTLLDTAFVYGTGTGPQISFSPSTISTIGSGFSGPYGVAVDGVGDIFVADYGNNAVKEIVAVSGAVSSSSTTNIVGSGFSNPEGVAVDGAGNVFVVDTGNSAVKEIVAVNGAVSSSSTVNTIGGGFNTPGGVAVDHAGNIFVADTHNNAVKEIVAVNGAVSSSSTVNTTGSGFNYPYGVSVDAAGDVFVGDSNNNAVKEIVAVSGAVSSSSTVTTIGSGFGSVRGVAVDSSGNVFVADYGSNAVKEIVAVSGAVSSSSTVITIGSGSPVGIAVDSLGNAFVGDYGNNAVKKIDYSDAPSLNFATTPINTTSSDSPKTVTITNRGNAALTFEVPSTGSNPSISAYFTFGASSTCPQLTTASSAATLAAQSSCTALISFSPTVTGSIGGSLVFKDNSLNAAGPSYTTQSVALSGISTTPAPVLTVAVASDTMTKGHASPYTPVTASGGTGTLTYAVSPSLPTGLSYSSTNGAVSGTPTVVHTSSSYTVTVTDSNNVSSTANFALAVNSVVVASTAVASTALTQNRAATSFVPVTGSGGTGTLTYSVSPTLPAGLSYAASTGTVSGTPTATSSSTTYTVTVTDVNGATATSTFSLTVNAVVVATTAIASTSLTNGRAATSFTPVTGSGGTSPLSYSVSPTLPTGLSFAAGTGTVSGTPTVVSSASTYTVTVTDANGATATSTFSLTVNAVVAAATAVASTSLTQSQAATPFVPVTGSGGTSPLSYSVSPTLPSGLNYAASTGTVSGTPTVASSAATYTVTVTDANGATAAATFSLAVVVAPAITFTVSNQTYGAAPFTVTATSNSTGAFTYSVVSGPATISGSTVTLTGTGTVVLQASQAANGNYTSGSQNASFTVSAAAPTITFTVANQTYGVAPFTVSATSNSSGAFTYTVVSGPATISGSTVTLTGNGTVVLRASQAANGNYTSGTQNASFTVAKAAPTITFTVANQNYGAAPFTVSATSNSSGAFTYTVVSGPASRSGSTVTLTGTGTVVLRASQAANGNYTTGTQNATFTVSVLSTNVGSTSATQTATVTLAASGTLGSIQVLTQGATGLDFNYTSGGTCTVGNAYTAGNSCTVSYTFSPAYPGQRIGAIVLLNSSAPAAPIGATSLIGNGNGPLVSFPVGTIANTVGTGTPGYSGDGGPAKAATLNGPTGVAVDGAGNIYISDTGNNVIRKVAASTGIITTFVGNGTAGYTGDSGAATSAELNGPYELAVDGAGNVYIADSGNNVIRKVTASTGIITTVAGTGTAGYSGDGGAATSATLRSPQGVAVDGVGNVYIADTTNALIRKVTATTGIISTVAGDGNGAGNSGDGGPALSADFNAIWSVAVDATGDIYIGQHFYPALRMVNISTGIINTVIGTGSSGGTANTTGPATSTLTGGLYGVAVDAAGNLYATDYTDNCIRVVNATTGNITTIAGNIGLTPADNGATSTASGIYSPLGIALAPNGNIYVAGQSENRIVLVNVAGPSAISLLATSSGSVSAATNQSVENIGNTALTVASIATSSNFSLGGAGTTCAVGGQTLAAAASCVLGIEYAPTGSGPATGNITLTDNTLNLSNATQAIATSAYQLTPALTVSTSGTPSSYGQSVTLTGALSTEGALPSGSMSFLDGGSSIGTGAIGSASTTNLVGYSQQIGGTSWTSYCGLNYNLLLDSTDYSSPDGTQTATKIANTSTSCDFTTSSWGMLQLAPGVLTAGSTYTVSVWARGAVGGELMTLGLNSCVQETSFTLTTSWQRYIATFPSISSSVVSCGGGRTFEVFSTGAGNTYYVWGPQVEAAAVAGPYVPTTGAASATGYGGTASYTTSALAVGSHTITSSWGGSASYAAATSPAITQNVNSAVTATVAIATATLTEGHAATAFIPVTGSGGTGTLTYSVSPTLPAGLSYATATGTVSGTPTATSSSTTYTVTITDSNGATAAANFSLTVNSVVVASVTVASTTLIENQAATAFIPITGSGGTTPLSYSVSPALPTGLSYAASTGTVSGTPTVVSSTATYTVTVTDVNGATATASFSLAVSVAPTITFNVSNQTYGAAPFTVAATSNSSGAFTYSVVSGPATISGATVTLTGTGTVVLQASQAANGNYTAGTQNASFTVSAAAPTITFSVSNKTYGTAPFSVSATSNSSGTFTYSVVSGPATISGATVTLTGAGTVVLQASQPASGNYAAGTQNASFTVNSAVVATTAIASSSLTQGSASTAFVPVTGSGGTGSLSYSVSPSLPSGLSFAASTGTVSGTPSVASAMTTYTVTVTDANSTTASANFSLTVNTAVTGAVNFGSLAVAASTPTTMSLAFTFTTASTIGAPRVFTQGAAGLDFKDAGTGTCTTNGTSHTYNAGDSCTVIVSFTPTRIGERRGAVQIVNGSGTLLATALVYGTGTGPQISFSPVTTSTIGSGFNQAYGVAVDGAGDVFVADYGNRAVKEIVAVNGAVSSSSTVITVGSGFSYPSGVAVDHAGDVFVADSGANAVKEIVAVNGAVSSSSTVNTIGSGFNTPNGVAVDHAGDIFVADFNNNAVKEIVAVNGAVSSSSTVNTIGSGFNGPFGVAVDTAGDVFVGDAYDNSVKEVVAVSGAVSSSSTVMTIGGFVSVRDVAVDSSGNVFVADYGAHAMKEIVAVNGAVSSSSSVVTVGSGFSGPSGVVVDGLGNVFVGDYGNNTVSKIDYSDAPSLTFANTAVNTTSSDSPKTVTVTNRGTAPLTFEVPGSGQNPSISSNFSFGGSSTCPQLTTSSSAATLAAQTSCTYMVSFTPTTVGALSGSLVTTDNSLNAASPSYASQSITLTGMGVTAPTITFSVPNQTFSSAPVTVAATSNSSGAFTYSVVSGPATISGATVTLTGAGTVVLQAAQAASGNYSAGTQNASFTVSAASTTLALQASSTTLTYGQQLTLTATLSPYQIGSTNTAGETITFKDGSTTLGTGTLSAGVATFMTSSLTAGSHTLTAVYGGDSNYALATSSSVAATVARAAVNVAVSGAPNPSNFGDLVSIAVTISGGSVVPTGTATLMDGSTTITTLTLNGSGNASYTTRTLNAGAHSLHVVYNGDSNYD